MNKKSLIVFSTLFLLIAFAGGAYLYKKSEKERLTFLAHKDFSVFVPEHAPRMGDKNAKIYLIEFLDPECESCRMMYPYVKDMMSAYQGKIQLVIRYAPFHGNSKFAVKILEASRKQGKYWETLEIMFRYQPQWGDHHHPRPELLWTLLPQVGLDVEQIKKDMNDPAIEALIEHDIRDLQTLEVRRTPSFFVDGLPLERFGPQHLRDLIDSVLNSQQ